MIKVYNNKVSDVKKAYKTFDNFSGKIGLMGTSIDQ